jgi:hypothetical protein
MNAIFYQFKKPNRPLQTLIAAELQESQKPKRPFDYCACPVAVPNLHSFHRNPDDFFNDISNYSNITPFKS